MIVGVIASDDRAAQRAVTSLAREVPHEGLSCSVRRGVAVASLGEVDSLLRSVWCEDYAYLGEITGAFPGPETELRGDFALIARVQGGLRLARARFAGRPLYWLRTGAIIAASNRLLPLAILARPHLELNVDHIVSLFDARLRVLRAPLPFVGVEKVRANRLIDIDASGTVREREGPIELGPELRIPAPELPGALRNEFQASVARQCKGARRIAVMAGGGVDSSNLLAVAVDNHRKRAGADVIPVAFDYGGPGDDRPHLRSLCDHLSIAPIRVAPVDGARYGGMDRVIDCSTHSAAPATLMLAAMESVRKAGAERVLNGEASELLLDSDPAVFCDFLFRDPLSALACAARFQDPYRTRLRSWRRLIFGPMARHLLPQFALRLRERRRHRQEHEDRFRELPWFGPRLNAFFDAPPSYPTSPAIYSARDRVKQLASSELVMATREHASRWEMMTGVPISLPYLDDDYARFVGRLPSGALFAGARERGLLRESMEALVPDSVRYRMDKARPYSAFAELFTAMGGFRSVEDLVTMRELAALGIVDASKYRQEFERFALGPSTNPRDWTMLWGAISAEAYVRWFREFKAGEVVPRHTSRSGAPPS